MGGTFAAMKDKNVMDSGENGAEWSDLSGGEKTARVMGGAMRGMGNGMQNMQQRPQPQGGGAPIQVTPNPQMPNNFDPNYLNAFQRR